MLLGALLARFCVAAVSVLAAGLGVEINRASDTEAAALAYIDSLLYNYPNSPLDQTDGNIVLSVSSTGVEGSSVSWYVIPGESCHLISETVKIREGTADHAYTLDPKVDGGSFGCTCLAHLGRAGARCERGRTSLDGGGFLSAEQDGETRVGTTGK